MVENKYLVNNKSSSQYFIVYPLLAMTEVKRFLQVFTRLVHTVAGILAHSSMQISYRAVMFWGCRRATRTFNSLQRFSMGLRSGDWLGHSRTLKCFLRSHSFVALALCLGSLSCWKTQPRFISIALADGRRFAPKISRYMAPFILSCTRTSRPGPFAEKQPQSMMLPPHASQLVWCSLDATPHSLPSKHDELCFYQIVLLCFHLTICHSPNTLLEHSNAL